MKPDADADADRGGPAPLTAEDVARLAELLRVRVDASDLEAVAGGLDTHARRMAPLRAVDMTDVPPATSFRASWDG